MATAMFLLHCRASIDLLQGGLACGVGVSSSHFVSIHTRLLSEGGVGVEVWGGGCRIYGILFAEALQGKKKGTVHLLLYNHRMLLSVLLSHLKPYTHAVHARSTVTPQQNATKQPLRCLNAASHTGSPVKNAAFFPPILNTSRCVFYIKAVSEKSNTHTGAHTHAECRDWIQHAHSCLMNANAQINAENAANSSGPSALLPGGPRCVGRLVNSCLHIWGTCVRIRAFVDDSAGDFSALSAPGWHQDGATGQHTPAQVSVSVCSVWNPDLVFMRDRVN